MDTQISTRLKSLRKNHSISLSEVTKYLSKNNIPYSAQTIYKWEDGTLTPSLNALKVLSNFYNCPLSYLVGGEVSECKRVSPIENNLLKKYRTDFLFRSIVTLIIKFIERD